MSENNDYTTGNLLDCEYFLKHYQLVAIELSKQTELETSLEKIILLASLKKIMEQQCFSSLKNKKKQL